MLEKPLLTIT